MDQNKFSTRIINKNMNDSLTTAQPVIHRPCSATLGKFHDSVNHSLIVGGNKSSILNTSKIQYDESDMRAKAREKFKYMTRTKTYVDESLFGTPNGKNVRDTPREYFQSTSQHLSHSQMSHITPLIHNVPIPSARASSRSERHINDAVQINNIQDTSHLSTTTRPKSRPWKP